MSRDAAPATYSQKSLFNVVDFVSGWRIDLICRKARAFSVAELERRSRHELAGLDIYLASAEDVVLAELEWAQLAQSNREIEEAAGIVRNQGDSLDTSYVDRWVE